jgi:hypothetical protein
MPIQRINFLSFVLILVLVMVTFQGIVKAQDTTPLLSKGAADTEKSSSLSISDLISFSTELSGRLSALQRNVELDFDLSGFGDAELSMGCSSSSSSTSFYSFTTWLNLFFVYIF